MPDSSRHWSIATNRLFDLINDKRRILNRPPMDNGTMAARLTLKYAANKTDELVPLNFSSPELHFDKVSMDYLEKVINDLFGLRLQQELARHCLAPGEKARVSRHKPPTPPATPPATLETEDKSVGNRLKKLFGRS